MKKKIKRYKMTPEELQNWLHFRNAFSVKENKKGKGSYKRTKNFKNLEE